MLCTICNILHYLSLSQSPYLLYMQISYAESHISISRQLIIASSILHTNADIIKLNDICNSQLTKQLLISLHVRQVVLYLFVPSTFNGHSCNQKYTVECWDESS